MVENSTLEKPLESRGYGADGILFGSGHGGNVGIKEAFGTGDENRLQNITFAILEVMDLNAEDGEIDRRETHWKTNTALAGVWP